MTIFEQLVYYLNFLPRLVTFMWKRANRIVRVNSDINPTETVNDEIENENDELENSDSSEDETIDAVYNRGEDEKEKRRQLIDKKTTMMHDYETDNDEIDKDSDEPDNSDSSEDETLDVVYNRREDEKEKRRTLIDKKTTMIHNYDIKIIGNAGQVTIGSATSQQSETKVDLMKFALVSYNQGVGEENMSINSSNLNLRSFFNVHYNLLPNFQAEDEAFFETLVRSHNHAYKSRSMGEDLMQNMMNAVVHNQSLTTCNAHRGYRLTVQRMVEVAKSVDEFRHLTEEEKSVLLAENTDMLVSLRCVIFFFTEQSGIQQLKLTAGYDDEKSIVKFLGEIPKIELDQLNAEGAIVYKQFNRLQPLSNAALEKEYENLQKDIGKMVTNEVISVLMTIIILFMSDFYKEKVIMYKYIKILGRYISNRTTFTSEMVNDTFSNMKKLQALKKRRRRVA